jgi:CBS domain-containing protein
MWWPAIGGLVIGVGGLVVPQALGVGYDVIGAELDGSIPLGLVIGVLVVKTLIWSLSLGSGTSGGVLAPMFMIGGALGTVEGQVFPHVAPGFWALVALAGVLGGVMRSPFTGVVFSVELTHRVDAILPLLIGASVAYGVSVLVLKRSVLTEKIARRGYHLTREYDVDPLEVLFVREVMSTDVVTFPADTLLDDVADTLVQRGWAAPGERMQRLYPVVGGDGRMLGVVSRSRVLERAVDPTTRGSGATVADLADAHPVVATPDETLRSVAYRMAEHGVSRLPVVDATDRHRVVGMVSLSQLLQGRLRDLREARHLERVLWFRPVVPLAAFRSRRDSERVG